MKLTINRAALAEASAWVAGAISRNPSAPILAWMRLHAGDHLELVGYDHDTAHRATVPASVEVEGMAVVSGRFLVQIVSAMKGDQVELSTDGEQVTIKSGRSTYRAQTMTTTEYPSLPDFPTHIGTIHAGDLVGVLGTVEHAVSKEPNLKALAAYNIRGNAGELTTTATDRFRLARATSRWADASASEFEVNVPGGALTSAVKGLEGDVQVGFIEGSFGLADEFRSVVTRVLGAEDRFPRTEPIFAVEPLVHVEANVAPLVEALKRALLVSDDNALVVVEFSDSLIRVRADGKTSDGTEEVDTDPGFGEGDMSLKFNAAFLTQALLASPASRVRFGLVAANKQVLIEPVGDSTAAFIVMPRSGV